MKSASSCEAVCQAVKRYTFPVLAVKFVNNSLRARESIQIMKSFAHHYISIQSLELSQNALSLQGSQFLASIIPELTNLKQLILKDCQMGDRGVAVILQ